MKRPILRSFNLADKISCFEFIKAAELYIDYIEKGHNRYEKLRKLNPRQFQELFQAHLKSGRKFDELVDELEVK